LAYRIPLDKAMECCREMVDYCIRMGGECLWYKRIVRIKGDYIEVERIR